MCPPGGAAEEAVLPVEEEWGVAGLRWAQVARYRRALLESYRVRTKGGALRFVRALGFCYAFTAGPGDLPGLFDVLDTRSVDRMWTWAWRWKDELVRQRKLFYGRLLARKPTFVSPIYLPCFFVLTGNVGEPDDYLQAYREGRLPRLGKEIYEYLRDHGRCSTWTLRRQFVPGGDRSGAFHRALHDLQERCLIAKVAEEERGSYAYIWDTFDRWLPEVVRAAAGITTLEAATVLLERYVQTLGAVSVDTAAGLFRWPPALFAAARRALAGRVVEAEIAGETVFVHPQLLATQGGKRPR
ncbi:MAG: hypothetical protein QN141_08180 [Armatimonadota bacterium]|nr:hypothetical protein [Armatimonadota bacterium]MDR7451158.1 hypothetical protein [Armatimonadota bacterium]MDR7467237.1 hypothetical protein [Armatimonadota bacterium]MDR7494835.1 hypothetical protein [Armatimonadota bacterium]MDR7500272.1 hypothetical protein [Armatimonadota bacterium]